MKRRIFLVLIIVIAALAIVVVVSGNGSRTPDKDLTAKATKVAAIFNGEPDDMGWGQAQFTALEDVREELNLEISYSFSVDFTDEESARAVFDKAISDGSDIVYTNSYDFVDWVKEYSERYPEVYFLSCAGSYTSGNVATFFGRIYQMRYLSGIVAGLTTETNHIGYVAAVPIPEVVRGINAFALGVQSVNPDAVVHVGWSDDWVNADKAHEQAVLLLDKYPIDVMTQHHDALDPMIEADCRGVYTIGYNVDQSEVIDHYLTAP
ncbi:MAG: BMP family ABC transporter substrate-binding protein, partial [Oscillospiraceae bacterium]